MPQANQWYNLWTLITQDISFTDPTFTAASYVSNVCKTFKYQSQNSTINANNGGANIRVSLDKNLEAGEELLSGQADSVSGVIDVKNVSVNSSIAGAGLNVSLVR